MGLFLNKASQTASTIGIIIETVAVFEINIDSTAVTAIKPGNTKSKKFVKSKICKLIGFQCCQPRRKN